MLYVTPMEREEYNLHVTSNGVGDLQQLHVTMEWEVYCSYM